MSADTKHPAPWRWREPFEHEDGIMMHALDDANGECVVADLGGIKDPLARELIRLAPELEKALRALEWISDRYETACYECGAVLPFRGSGVHEDGCSIARILAALDAARAVKP